MLGVSALCVLGHRFLAGCSGGCGPLALWCRLAGELGCQPADFGDLIDWRQLGYPRCLSGVLPQKILNLAARMTRSENGVSHRGRDLDISSFGNGNKIWMSFERTFTRRLVQIDRRVLQGLIAAPQLHFAFGLGPRTC